MQMQNMYIYNIYICKIMWIKLDTCTSTNIPFRVLVTCPLRKETRKTIFWLQDSIGRIKSDDEWIHSRIEKYYGNVSMSDIGRSPKLSAILKWQANGCQNMWEPQVLRPNCEECHPKCSQFASSKTWSAKVFRCQTDAATGPSEKLAWQTLSIP